MGDCPSVYISAFRTFFRYMESIEKSYAVFTYLSYYLRPSRTFGVEWHHSQITLAIILSFILITNFEIKTNKTKQNPPRNNKIKGKKITIHKHFFSFLNLVL